MQVLEPGLLPSLKTSENIKVFDEGVTARGDVEYFRLDQDVLFKNRLHSNWEALCRLSFVSSHSDSCGQLK